jgi:hypothetical protein
MNSSDVRKEDHSPDAKNTIIWLKVGL